MDKKTINIVVPDETKQRFKIACIKSGKSQKHILIKLIDNWTKKERALEREEKQKKDQRTGGKNV
jgi:hypothetical protein